MVRPVIPPSKVNVGDPTAVKAVVEAASGKASKKSKEGRGTKGVHIVKKTKKAKAVDTDAAAEVGVKKARRKKKKAEPSRSKAKKLARKMLALQRRTDPILTKTVIRELAHDAAPSMRFTKSAREALQYAVEAYAQGACLLGDHLAATLVRHRTQLCTDCCGCPFCLCRGVGQVSLRPRTRSAAALTRRRCRPST